MRKQSISTLKAKADKLMSQYIRQKYADHDGRVKCVSCGIEKPWKEMDCGHFIPKSRGAAVRYVEENVHPECPGCNRFNEGHLINYTRYMIEMYGDEKIDELQAESRRVISPVAQRYMIEKAIEYYLDKLKEMDG